MKEELELTLGEAFPFMQRDRNVDMKERKKCKNAYQAWGCECSDGWYPLIYELCREISDRYAEEGVPADLIVLQVKEKWAGLRFYYSYPGEPHTPQVIDCFGGPSLRLYPRGDADDSRRTLKQDITSIVQKYEEKSKTVCEKCGREGSVRKNLPHICTLCDACYENCSKTRG